jgi:transposase
VKNNKQQSKRTRRSRPLLERVNQDAAGIDCGAETHFVAVPPGRDPEPVRSFRTFTGDLERLVEWLVNCRIKTVAMEATGVYWVPIYEMLEARGIEPVLVNARHVKNVPGRKSDVADCEWLQELHSVGLLRGSFRPTAEIAALRSYMRHRESLIESASTAINRMQKALVQMNVQLHVVISDITGATGLRILRDIVEGKTDPRHLAAYRDPRCKASEEQIAAALTGHYLPEHLFVLRQNLALYDTYQSHVAACDGQIEIQLKALAARVSSPTTPMPVARSRRNSRSHEPNFDVRTPLRRLSGVDLSQIDGIGPYNALRLISEIGTDMSRWPTERHFTSWLALAPNNKVSGGRLISSRTQPSANRAAMIFRMAAMSLGRTQTALGAFYRRLAYRIGKAKAITATARKIAVLFYRMLRERTPLRDLKASDYDRAHRRRSLSSLARRVRSLGLEIIDPKTGALVTGTVS